MIANDQGYTESHRWQKGDSLQPKSLIDTAYVDGGSGNTAAGMRGALDAYAKQTFEVHDENH